MKNIFGIAITIICIMVMALLSGVYINVNLQIQNAREFHANVIERVQASHYSAYVINECKTNASTKGYKLDITNTGVYEDINDYYITLDYDVKVPLLGTSSSGTLEGYAR